jgi:hypothetical protein
MEYTSKGEIIIGAEEEEEDAEIAEEEEILEDPKGEEAMEGPSELLQMRKKNKRKITKKKMIWQLPSALYSQESTMTEEIKSYDN